ncbi:MAG: OmpA family protein [Calditrichota bacterium]
MRQVRGVILGCILLTFFLSHESLAQSADSSLKEFVGRSSLGLHGSAAHFLWGNRDDSKISPWFVIQYNYSFTPHLSMEFSGGAGYDRPRDRSRSDIIGFLKTQPGTPYWTTVIPLSGNLRFDLRPNVRYNQYFILGGGVLAWEVRNLDQKTIVSGPHINPMINIGTGTEYFLGDNTALDLSIRYHHLPFQKWDMSGLGDVNTGNIEMRLGLDFFFGGQQDRDHDGIIDKDDHCPDDPEDKDGFQDQDGCPDLDNDQDGIVDAKDKCPDVAEDQDGFQDQDGCPDLDNDQDGIPDVKDQCPNLAEDRDGYQDSDGCPDLDNDSDGIPDSVDQCPDQPETVNGYQDQDGCPDEKPSPPKPEPESQLKIIREKPMILEGVNFEFNSSNLTRNSKRILDLVLGTLRAHPAMEVQIRGYTDSVGDPTYNPRLSQLRAEAVRQYLISQGIAGSRLKAVGFGEEYPIASNATKEGRSKNRRIEIIRIDQASLGGDNQGGE